MSATAAIVVGASSGMGEALARRLVKSGTKVALLARRGAEVERIATEINAASGGDFAFGWAHDVLEPNSIDAVWDAVETKLGKDVGQVYFTAGIMEPVEMSEFDTDKDTRHFMVNAVGFVAWANAAAHRFIKKGFGTICAVSSVAADRGRVGKPAYGASKAGLDHFAEALRNRLWRRGITVTTIRPGFVETPMTKGLDGMFWVISADQAAEQILRAVRKRKSVAYVPGRWRLVMAAIRNVPSFVFRKLNV